MNSKIFQVFYYLIRFVLHPGVSVSARLPLSQAMLESASWSSNLYKSSNNMFGMKYPTTRKTCATGKTLAGYAIYRSPFDSIRDYFLRLEYFNLTTDNAVQANFSSYAQDGSYTNKIAALQPAVLPLLIPVSTFATATLAGLGAVVVGVLALNEVTK